MQTRTERIHILCPDIPPETIASRLENLGARYNEQYSDEDIAAHFRGLATLNHEQPVNIIITEGNKGQVECTFLAYDYPGLFSMFAGILTGMGFDIQNGDCFTLARSSDPDATSKTHKRFYLPRSYQITRPKPRGRRREVIDNFRGMIMMSENFDHWRERLISETKDVVGLMENEAFEQARQQVNLMVTTMLESLYYKTPPVLYPVNLTIDNESDAFTHLKVVSQDTPAFLYSLTNALSLGGVNIESVSIKTRNHEISDEIAFTDSTGRRIEDEESLRLIRMSVLFTKQFTYFLPTAPDPYRALTRFNKLLHDVMCLPESIRWIESFSQTRNLNDLARVLGASDFIWEDFIRLQYEALSPILEPAERAEQFFHTETLIARLTSALDLVEIYEDKIKALNTFKDHEIFLIDLENILGTGTYEPRAMAEKLTFLAETVLQSAYHLAYAHLKEQYGVPRTIGGIEAPFAVLGLGKLGGIALGYASDLELIFVYSDNGRTDGANPIENAQFFERMAREFLEIIQAKREGIFEIDLQLRPHGKKGPLACSLEAFCRYFGPGGEAHSYERLALVRLRALAGDKNLGQRFERLRDEFIYEADSIDVTQLRELRHRQYQEKAGPTPNVKFSPGGLVDLEYDVQILQVMCGRENESPRTPRIHMALQALRDVQVLSPEESERLDKAYYFLRHVINGLRMLRGNAKDLFLPVMDSTEFRHLARRMGYERKGDLRAAHQLYVDFETHTAVVRSFVEKHFGRDSLPGPVTGNVADVIFSSMPSEELSHSALHKLGLKNTTRAAHNLRRLAGEGEQAERFAMLAVLACDMLKDMADPDMALNNWERFVNVLPDAKHHFETLLAQPKRLDVFLSIVATSQFLANTLVTNPDFFEWATSPAVLNRSLTRRETLEALRALGADLHDRELWLDALRRFRRRHFLRIGARDVCLGARLDQITADLSVLADSLVQATLDRFSSEHPESAQEIADRFCILAFGKLGGSELNYSSDIDLLAVYEGPFDPVFVSAVEQLRHDLSDHTTEGHIYRIDLRLRPYGRGGALAQSVESVQRYYETVAGLWEIQALLKLRPIAGSTSTGARLMRGLHSLFKRQRPASKIAWSIDSLRKQAMQRVTRQSGSHLFESGREAGLRNIKDGAGGIRDIEFLVQGMQLAHVHDDENLIEGNTLKAIGALTTAGHLSSEQADSLSRDYILLRRTEHFLQIMEDRQTHALPKDEGEINALARRVLGVTHDTQSFTKQIQECQTRIHDAFLHYVQKYSAL